MSERIGVFICACGPNIRDAMDLDELARFAQKLDHVVFCEIGDILCDPGGKERIGRLIFENKLTRVVVAACSPKEHESTFRRVLSKAGLNPFLFQMANIREQCAWVTRDRSHATKKARAAISAAVKRVMLQKPLSPPSATCNPDVLVIGAGVAGISAARRLARHGRRVYLVEKSPCIGGHAARFDELFYDMSCASCMLSPYLDEVLHHENIQVMVGGEVTGLTGFFGHFIARVTTGDTKVDPEKCIGCQACIAACPVSVPNEFNEKLDDRKAIHMAYPGAQPGVAAIDSKNCHRSGNDPCSACQEACAFDAIDLEKGRREQEFTVGAIIVATGFDPVRLENRLTNVMTDMELERVLCESGPTEGKLRTAEGTAPTDIALAPASLIFHESRGLPNQSASDTIVTALMAKYSNRIQHLLPHCQVTAFVSQTVFSGATQRRFFQDAFSNENRHLEKVPDFLAIGIEEREAFEKPWIVKTESERARIRKADRRVFDLVVLISDMSPARDTEKLCERLEISRNSEGYFFRPESMMEPVSSDRKGIFVAGACTGPKAISESAADGVAAAGEVLGSLIEGRPLESIGETAEIDSVICGGCGICQRLCPHQAITEDQETHARRVNPLLCRGCGTCAAGCPTGAVEAHHFTQCQVRAEIKGLLEG